MKLSHRLLILGILLYLTFMFIWPLFVDPSLLNSDLPNMLQAPNILHWFGTDGNGRDILVMMAYGARVSLFIAVTVVLLNVIIGVLVGFSAGYKGGMLDRFFIFFSDIFQSFPGTLLAIALAAFLRPGIKNMVFLLAFVGWVSFARVARAQVLSLKSMDFITATNAMGASHFRKLIHHFLPNMAGPLVVQASFGMAGVVLAESTLSFLGLGLPPSVPSLGRVLESGVNLLLVAPYVSIFPGMLLLSFVLFFNVLGDLLRHRVTEH